MGDFITKNVPGGPGLNHESINVGSGLKKRWWSTTTTLDLSGGGSTVSAFVAPSAGRIHRVRALYDEAVSSGESGTIVCGSILYSSGSAVTDADKFATMQPTASSAIGTVEDITLTTTDDPAGRFVNFAEGELITVGYTTHTGAGTAQIMVEYSIDDENNA